MLSCGLYDCFTLVLLDVWLGYALVLAVAAVFCFNLWFGCDGVWFDLVLLAVVRRMLFVIPCLGYWLLV